jgi:hypothetical protein
MGLTCIKLQGPVAKCLYDTEGLGDMVQHEEWLEGVVRRRSGGHGTRHLDGSASHMIIGGAT